MDDHTAAIISAYVGTVKELQRMEDKIEALKRLIDEEEAEQIDMDLLVDKKAKLRLHGKIDTDELKELFDLSSSYANMRKINEHNEEVSDESV